jgi:uncharacterized membrane protein YfcA
MANKLDWFISVFGVLLFLVAILWVQNDISSDGHRRLLTAAHKPLLPLDFQDVVGTVLISLGLLIAASGGIGGGGILVPLYILVFEFGPKHAVALSNFSILSTSMTNMIINLPKRHPFADRPLVDWDLILVMEPLTMGGAVVGAMLSKLLPDWILVLSLVVLLGFTTQTTLEKGFKQYKEESKSFMEDLQEKHQAAQENQPLMMVNNEDDIDDFPEIRETKQSVILEDIMEQEKGTPWDKVWIIILLVLVVTLLNYLKGGGYGSPIGVRCGSFWYWFLTAAVFVWILAIAWYMRSELIEKWKVKKANNYKYLQGDMEWNPINTIKYPLICVFAGFCAGLFGIGGGIVKGPLMLYMGVHPLVASATCAVMIFFTSIAATAIFISFGMVQFDYGVYFAIVGLIATVIGQFGVAYLVKKYKRASLVSLSIGAVVAISTVLMGVQGVLTLVEGAPSNETPRLCTK